MKIYEGIEVKREQDTVKICIQMCNSLNVAKDWLFVSKCHNTGVL